MDPEMDHKMDSEILEEASPTESMPSSTDEWDRGTTYEYSPKKSKFPKRPLPPRPTTTFLILGRIITTSALPRFMHMWANIFFPEKLSPIPHTLTSLSTHLGTVDTIIGKISSLLSSQPFISKKGGQGWAHFVHQVLHKRFLSGSALIQDFQDLINGCEKKIYYSIEGGGACWDCGAAASGGGGGGGVVQAQAQAQAQVLPLPIPTTPPPPPPQQGTYVEMQTESLQTIGCRIGKRLLRMLAGKERTRKLEADLTNWIADTEKWVESGMKEVKKEEARLATEGWIYESDDFFWQDELYRPMQQ